MTGFTVTPVTRKPALRAMLAAVAVFALPSTWASSLGEKIVCTDAPRHTWLSEAQARQRFGADRYLLARFKISKGNCHEFYAVQADGTVVEAYLHPVTGATLRLTRIPPSSPGSSTTPVRP